MNAIKHFITITKHRHQVFIHAVKAGIPLRGLLHDLSKYSPTEFIAGIKFYKGTRSPNDGERAKYGYSQAWMHHKGRNRHHFEYWTDYVPGGIKVLKPVKMPLVFLKEMFCDRVAASKIYNKDKYTDADSYNYYMRGKDNRLIHPETAAMLEKLLTMLKDEGEEKTFKYIKSLKEY